MIYVKCTLDAYILAIHWEKQMLIEVNQPIAVVKLTSSNISST